MTEKGVTGTTETKQDKIDDFSTARKSKFSRFLDDSDEDDFSRPKKKKRVTTFVDFQTPVKTGPKSRFKPSLFDKTRNKKKKK